MKNLLFLGFLIAAMTVRAEIEMVPLDMKLGYWETNVEMLQSEAMNKALENIPEAQRAMMQKMMRSKMKMPATKQCITDDSFKDMEKKIRESMGDQEAGQDCNFKVINSNSKELHGKLSCKGMKTFIHTKVINPKRHESTVESTVAGMGETKLSLLAEWKAETCPEGL